MTYVFSPLAMFYSVLFFCYFVFIVSSSAEERKSNNSVSDPFESHPLSAQGTRMNLEHLTPSVNEEEESDKRRTTNEIEMDPTNALLKIPTEESMTETNQES